MLMWCRFALNIRFVTFWDGNQLWTSPLQIWYATSYSHVMLHRDCGLSWFSNSSTRLVQQIWIFLWTTPSFELEHNISHDRGSVSKNNLKSKLTNIPFKFQKCILILTCIQKDVDRLVLAVLLWNDADISLSRTIPEQHLLQHAGTAKQTPQSQSLPSPG